MSMETLGDTDLETIINDFACKQFGVMKLFAAVFFQKAHIDRVAETRVTSTGPLLSIFRRLAPLQLPYNALT